VNEPLERVVEAVRLTMIILKDRSRDFCRVSALPENLPPSKIKSQTKAFNVMSRLLLEASTILVNVSKGNIILESHRIDGLLESCQNAIVDMAEEDEAAGMADLRNQLSRVEALQNAALSTVGRELITKHWPRIADGDPGLWFSASDAALQFFLDFFSEPSVPVSSLAKDTQAEVYRLAKTLSEDDRWRFAKWARGAS
jgi:hypothetical protein